MIDGIHCLSLKLWLAFCICEEEKSELHVLAFIHMSMWPSSENVSYNSLHGSLQANSICDCEMLMNSPQKNKLISKIFRGARFENSKVGRGCGGTEQEVPVWWGAAGDAHQLLSELTPLLSLPLSDTLISLTLNLTYCQIDTFAIDNKWPCLSALLTLSMLKIKCVSCCSCCPADWSHQGHEHFCQRSWRVIITLPAVAAAASECRQAGWWSSDRAAWHQWTAKLYVQKLLHINAKSVPNKDSHKRFLSSVKGFNKLFK